MISEKLTELLIEDRLLVGIINYIYQGHRQSYFDSIHPEIVIL